jgi:hypothetical protein
MIHKLRWSFLVCVLGCGGGGSEPAKNASSSDCPPGMTKEGGECVAPEGQGGPGKAADTTPKPTTTTTDTSSTNTSNTGTGTSTTAPAGDKVAYDKDSVEVVLKRAANQVKGNCGAASDENGKANGPWGTAKIQVRLGRNGHVRGVEVPERYADKPVGVCIVHAFQNLVFPPYAAPSDVVVEWEVEIVRPTGG